MAVDRTSRVAYNNSGGFLKLKQRGDRTLAAQKIALINFYNQKALAIRYIEGALTAAGFDVAVLHIGGYRAQRSSEPDEAGVLRFLETLGASPLWIGLSVTSSFFLGIAESVSDLIKKHTGAPIVWGGVYATLLAERCLAHCDYVIRGEGEYAAAHFSRRLASGSGVGDVPNLVYRKNGKIITNPMRPFDMDLGTLPIAELGLPNKYYLDDDTGRLHHMDPYVNSSSYETAASRGCPFACSFCSAVSIKRLYPNAAHYTRTRAPGDVIDELKSAKAKMKRLSFIRFWDEIFSTDPLWVDEFAARYKTEINLPFEAWTHPLKTDAELLAKLRAVGLRCVSMGIQSGSPEVRKKVFRRAESQEQILAAANMLTKSRIPYVTYDFILGHPLETPEQLKESYELCTRLPGRFLLQLHGLSFLPGTDIVEEAVKQGLYTREAMEEMIYLPMERQYSLWNEAKNANPEIEFWYNLIFMTQFPLFRAIARRLAKHSQSPKHRAKAARRYRLSKLFLSLRHIRQKGLNVVLERR